MKHAARRRTRTLAAAGALVLLGSLTACGDDGGDGGEAPSSASTEEFCDAFGGVFGAVAEAGEDPQAQIGKVKDAVDELEDVGTPEDIPDQARDGFEVFVDLFDDVDEDTTVEEFGELGDDLSDSDNTAGEEFTTWAAETCPDALGEMMPSPAELEGIDPSDLESGLAELEESEPAS